MDEKEAASRVCAEIKALTLEISKHKYASEAGKKRAANDEAQSVGGRKKRYVAERTTFAPRSTRGGDIDSWSRVTSAEKTASSSPSRKRHGEQVATLCFFFQQQGHCARQNCPFVHDKSRVPACCDFLIRSCTNPKCRLAHTRDKRRVPTCSKYLDGTCANWDCPFVHVYYGPRSVVCEAFSAEVNRHYIVPRTAPTGGPFRRAPARHGRALRCTRGGHFERDVRRVCTSRASVRRESTASTSTCGGVPTRLATAVAAAKTALLSTRGQTR